MRRQRASWRACEPFDRPVASCCSCLLKADQYLRLAGGPTTGADARSIFVIRANGSVVSARQSSGWFNNNGLAGLTAEPGDTIFVPEEMDKTTFIQYAKDWTQILSQFALGVAAIQVLGN